MSLSKRAHAGAAVVTRSKSGQTKSKTATHNTNSKKRLISGGADQLTMKKSSRPYTNTTILPLLQLKGQTTTSNADLPQQELARDKQMVIEYTQRINELEDRLETIMASHKTDLREFSDVLKEQMKNQADMTFWTTAVLKDVNSLGGDLADWVHSLNEKSKQVQKESEERLQALSDQLKEQMRSMQQYHKWSRCMSDKESAQQCIDELTRAMGPVVENEKVDAQRALHYCLQNESSAAECFVQISKLYPQLKPVMNPPSLPPRPSKKEIAAVMLDQSHQNIQGVMHQSGALEQISPPIPFQSQHTNDTLEDFDSHDVSDIPLAPPLPSNTPVITFTTSAARKNMQNRLTGAPTASKGTRNELLSAIKNGIQLRKSYPPTDNRNHVIVDAQGSALPIQSERMPEQTSDLMSTLRAQLLRTRNFVEPEEHEDTEFNSRSKTHPSSTSKSLSKTKLTNHSNSDSEEDWNT
jgi:hypothetical protein